MPLPIPQGPAPSPDGMTAQPPTGGNVPQLQLQRLLSDALRKQPRPSATPLSTTMGVRG